MGQHQFCSGFITGGGGEPHFCNGLNDLIWEEAGGGGGGKGRAGMCRSSRPYQGLACVGQ